MQASKKNYINRQKYLNIRIPRRNEFAFVVQNNIYHGKFCLSLFRVNRNIVHYVKVSFVKFDKKARNCYDIYD